jgi:hypothetical protein
MRAQFPSSGNGCERQRGLGRNSKFQFIFRQRASMNWLCFLCAGDCKRADLRGRCFCVCTSGFRQRWGKAKG